MPENPSDAPRRKQVSRGDAVPCPPEIAAWTAAQLAKPRKSAEAWRRERDERAAEQLRPSTSRRVRALVEAELDYAAGIPAGYRGPLYEWEDEPEPSRLPGRDASPRKPKQSWRRHRGASTCSLRTVRDENGRELQLLVAPDHVRGLLNGIIRGAKGGRLANEFLAHEVPAHVARYARRACTGEFDPTLDPENRWKPSDIAYRLTLATFALYWKCKVETARRGMHAKVEGFTYESIRSLLINPLTNEPYSRSRIHGTSWGVDRCDPSDGGSSTLLHRAGALYRNQPPADRATPVFVGSDRDGEPRAFAVYWFTQRAVFGTSDADERVDPPPD